MRIIVFNCGSSSLKYRLIDMPSETELAAGEAERVGPKTALPGCIHHHVGTRRKTSRSTCPTTAPHSLR